VTDEADLRCEEQRGTDTHERLAKHLSTLGMGYPPRPELLEFLRTLLTSAEAEVALLLPTALTPLEVISADEVVDRAFGGAVVGPPLDAAEIARTLKDLAARGLLFAGTTPEGERGYGLLQVGFGFPQTLFWDGGHKPESAAMADLVIKYFNRDVTREAYGGTTTKPYRYVPVNVSLDEGLQAVLPAHAMTPILEQAQTFAVAHCPCRVALRLRGRACEHPEDVCIKFDDLAEYLIERGLGREIDRDEAFDVIRRSEEAGLVHFVDNAEGNVKHNCNCCGCACWNVGSIRRRKIPRDVLMATYFMRTTDLDECTGCGRCAEVCPVEALALVPRPGSARAAGRGSDTIAVVDPDWCIGCGVCVPRCPSGAAGLLPRADVSLDLAPDFVTLHRRILDEKGLL
jgi:formate hydrogenlyase subunit 6/NADH:ubiquinone oxidoreductase subunit I